MRGSFGERETGRGILAATTTGFSIVLVLESSTASDGSLVADDLGISLGEEGRQGSGLVGGWWSCCGIIR